MNAQAKVVWQALLLAQKSNVHCLYSYRPLKNKESRNEKNFEAKKNNYSLAANNINRNRDQFSQISGQSFKKNSCSNRRD